MKTEFKIIRVEKNTEENTYEVATTNWPTNARIMVYQDGNFFEIQDCREARFLKDNERDELKHLCESWYKENRSES